jgi:hypothetical protein
MTMRQSLQQLLEQYEQTANQIYDLHQKYITDAWGTFALTQETYREIGEKDWVVAKAALSQLKERAQASVPLLERTSLVAFLDVMQGMHIRLSQRFAETPGDPSCLSDKTQALHLWQALNQTDRELYQQLG